MAGFENDVVYALNADFSTVDNQTPSAANGLATNGQLWIGSTAANAGGTHINVGALTSPNGTISFSYSSPNITAEVVNQNFDPIGTLQYFSSGGSDTTYPGPQWLKCDGSVLAQASYTVLFSRLGLLNGAGTVWTKNSSQLIDYVFTGVAYGNSTYVRVSNSLGNFVSTSTDGITWVSRTTGVTSALSSIVFGNGIFVAAGTGGAMATSTDGITWTAQTSGSVAAINALVYNGTRFAFPTSQFVMSSSTDAVTWTQYASPVQVTMSRLAASNGTSFVGSTTTWFYVTSTDGVAWSSRTPTVAQAISSSGTRSIVYGGGQYVCCTGGPSVSNSPDGVVWTARSTGATTLSFTSVVYGGNYVVGGFAGIVYSSTDAVTWTARTSNTSSSIFALGFGASTYVYGTAAGGGGTSTDGTTWVAHNTGSASAVRTITYGTVFAYGFIGGGLSTSTDGVTFTARTSGTASVIQCINYLNGQYVYGGAGGVLATSTDAITWNAQTSGTTSTILAMAYGNEYVYCGVGGAVATSTDAVTWTQRFSGKVSSLDSIIWDGSKYIAAIATGGHGFITSTDAITWTVYNPPGLTSGIQVLSLYYGSEIIAGASAGQIYTTTDTFTWTYRPGLTGFVSGVTSITSTGGKFYAVGNYPTTTPVVPVSYAGSSTDGRTWYPVLMGTSTDSFNSLVYGDKFVAVGNSGVTWTASGTYGYNAATSFQLPVDLIQRLTYESQDNYSKTLYIRAT